MEQNKNISGLKDVVNAMREHTQSLGKLTSSTDGEAVKRMMGQDADRLKEAVKSGDMATLKQTFDNLMRTEEGARLIGKIRDQITEK